MDWPKLTDELRNDPLAIGYASMTDEQVVSSLSTITRTRTRARMTGDEVFQQTDPDEFSAVSLTDAKRSMWLAFCGRNEINPDHANNKAFVLWVFGSGSATVANLLAARQESVSRAVELQLGGTPTVADITKVRSWL